MKDLVPLLEKSREVIMMAGFSLSSRSYGSPLTHFTLRQSRKGPRELDGHLNSVRNQHLPSK